MKSFEGLGLHPVLEKSLTHMKYTTPTPIQAQAIPLALAGRDILGSAQTGTGKTAAFAIPLIDALLRSPDGSALVLTPTRELGKQIMDIMRQLLGPNSDIKTTFLIGGDSMGKQCAQLRQKPRLIVGTPGRINDHLERGNLKLGDTGFLVLDETDRMLDMGFSVQLDRIFKYMPKKRQTLMFSATLPQNILRLSGDYLHNPQRIAVGSTVNPADNIKQEVVRVGNTGKYDELVRQINEREGSILVFVKTKYGTEKLAKRLRKEKFDADFLHGDLRQNRRERVIRDFRNQKFRILFATDVAARGLDIPHIEHVINHDLPQVPEDYIHRIGRTARAGAKGSSLCLIGPQDELLWNAIECLMDPSKKLKKAPNSRKSRKGFGKKPRNQNNRSSGEDGAQRRERQDSKPYKKPYKKSGGKFGDTSGGKPAYKGKKNHSQNDNDRPDNGEQKRSSSDNRSSNNGEQKRSNTNNSNSQSKYRGKKNNGNGNAQDDYFSKRKKSSSKGGKKHYYGKKKTGSKNRKAA